MSYFLILPLLLIFLYSNVSFSSIVLVNPNRKAFLYVCPRYMISVRVTFQNF